MIDRISIDDPSMKLQSTKNYQSHQREEQKMGTSKNPKHNLIKYDEFYEE
jgi:hypothetical protein